MSETNESRPCDCGKPFYDEDYEDEIDPDGNGDTEWCEHWCIEDVPTNRLRDGDMFAIRGDIPLEVSWHVVVGDADPVTGAHLHRSVDRAAPRGGPSTPFEPDQPTQVLRLGFIGRQTLFAEPPMQQVREERDVNEAATWTDLLRCERCNGPLDQPGALIFSPPRVDGTVRKHHICADCYPLLTGAPATPERFVLVPGAFFCITDDCVLPTYGEPIECDVPLYYRQPGSHT